MSAIQLVVYGEPVAQGRPKFSTAGGFVRAYDPAKSRDYKDYIKLAAASQMQGRTPLEGPLELSVRIYRPIPSAMSKKRAAAAERGEIRPTTKPDLDNYLKAIKDALKGICWHDDSQVVAYREPFGKYYSAKKTLEGTVKERDKQLEELKKVDAAGLQAEITRLQAENTKAQSDFEAKLKATELDYKLDAAIMKEKGKNPRAIKALIDTGKLKIKDDGTIEGLDLAALKTSDPYLFEISTSGIEGTGGAGGGDGSGSGGGGIDPDKMSMPEYKAWREKQK